MIDPVKILQRAWHILWNYRTLWVFGFIVAFATGAGLPQNRGNNDNGVQYRFEAPSVQAPTPESVQQAWRNLVQEGQKLFQDGIPQANITGRDFTNFIWILGIFVLVSFLVEIAIAIVRYVSETAIIRMVDEYESTGAKRTVREGFRLGWSRAAWRLFLIDLILALPFIAFLVLLLIAGVMIFLAVVNGKAVLTATTFVVIIGLLFLTLFVVIIVSIFLGLLKPFFWRVSVLEDAGVRESLRRGFALARENWKSAGIMWLVMIGLAIAWAIALAILWIISIPVLIITLVAAAIVIALPGLLLVGLFSLFLSGWLPWAAAALFMLPLFILIGFSPWFLLGSWQTVYTSTVWTLTYREIKATPGMILPPADLEPVGD